MNSITLKLSHPYLERNRTEDFQVRIDNCCVKLQKKNRLLELDVLGRKNQNE
jgi:hypothetical protein